MLPKRLRRYLADKTYTKGIQHTVKGNTEAVGDSMEKIVEDERTSGPAVGIEKEERWCRRWGVIGKQRRLKCVAQGFGRDIALYKCLAPFNRYGT